MPGRVHFLPGRVLLLQNTEGFGVRSLDVKRLLSTTQGKVHIMKRST